MRKSKRSPATTKPGGTGALLKKSSQEQCMSNGNNLSDFIAIALNVREVWWIIVFLMCPRA